MIDQAKVTMILCAELDPLEQEKLDRLDAPISQRFVRANLVARICQGHGSGADRVLNFCGPAGVVGTIRAAEFVSASDDDAVEMIALSGSEGRIAERVAAGDRGRM